MLFASFPLAILASPPPPAPVFTSDPLLAGDEHWLFFKDHTIVDNINSNYLWSLDNGEDMLSNPKNYCKEDNFRMPSFDNSWQEQQNFIHLGLISSMFNPFLRLWTSPLSKMNLGCINSRPSIESDQILIVRKS